MKPLSTILVSVLLLMISFSAQPQGFEEGLHYTRIAKQKREADKNERREPEIVEYFSFSCPGCYAIEPLLLELTEAEPTLTLRTVHLPYGGSKARLSQKAFVLMTMLDAQQHKAAIFSRIHEQRNVFDSEGEIADFFQSLGYSRDKVAAILMSFSADSMIRKMNREAINRKIRSVPTIVVNNSYVVNLRLVNTADRMAALIRYLNTLP
jgi:thiol:disulfide interchange protein DsbA